jgi:hypothetical protein
LGNTKALLPSPHNDELGCIKSGCDKERILHSDGSLPSSAAATKSVGDAVMAVARVLARPWPCWRDLVDGALIGPMVLQLAVVVVLDLAGMAVAGNVYQGRSV